jgi:hypothetical protein
MVAEPFDGNPRRVKQFMNLFRLRAYIASETGLFSDSAEGPALTLVQLAKLVAISLQWPELQEEAANDASLMTRMERQLTGGTIPGEFPPSWLDDERLVRLLKYGLGEAENSVAGIDFRRIVRVLPPVPRLAGKRAMSEGEAAELADEGYLEQT